MPSDPPAYLDYELWQGPAPRRPYRDNVVHYQWHWFWHYGNGELGNNGPHCLDLCRWGLQVDYPIRVTSSGGRYCFDDDQETPDTHAVAYEFPGKKQITYHGVSCSQREAGPFVLFYGSDGTMEIDGQGGYTIFDSKNQEVEKVAASGWGQKSMWRTLSKPFERTILPCSINQSSKATRVLCSAPGQYCASNPKPRRLRRKQWTCASQTRSTSSLATRLRPRLGKGDHDDLVRCLCLALIRYRSIDN